ncbi:MAG: HEPN domain-containing protein [Vulcanimicrobiota bacterium]
MTEENRRLNVQFEYEKADVSVREVEVLIEQSLWAAAVSRAYYGMFHLARALLFALGMEAKSHSGMVHLLSAHLVRTEAFPPEMIRAFSRMQRLREDADYQTAMRFDQETAQEARLTLLAFRKETVTFLQEKGYIPQA